jgi:uncharacterized protein
MTASDLFPGHRYISLETFRKTGVGVRTPVWFAVEKGILYLYTLADSGKIKRIRNNPKVRIAPSDVRGKVLGDWVDARAWILSKEEAEHADRLLNKKYALKRLFDWTSRLRSQKRAYVAVQPVRENA